MKSFLYALLISLIFFSSCSNDRDPSNPNIGGGQHQGGNPGEGGGSEPPPVHFTPDLQVMKTSPSHGKPISMFTRYMELEFNKEIDVDTLIYNDIDPHVNNFNVFIFDEEVRAQNELIVEHNKNVTDPLELKELIYPEERMIIENIIVDPNNRKRVILVFNDLFEDNESYVLYFLRC